MLANLIQPNLRSVVCWSLPMGLVLLNGFWQPVKASWNQFDVCISELVNNGVSSANAQTGCAGALIPKQLSQCVAMIHGNTGIDGEAALRSCFQVRWPVDLGNCVVDIQNSVLKNYSSADEKTANASNSLAIAAMNSCQASLAPGRHSECVIAVSRNAPSTGLQNSLDTCLAAEDFPRDLFPAYSKTQPSN